jgi:protein TonB
MREIAIADDPRVLSETVDFSEPMNAGGGRSRFAAAFGASAVAHAVALGVLLLTVHPRDVEKPVVIFPISLGSMPGGDGIPGAAPGEPAPGPPAAAVEPPAPSPPPVVDAPKPVEQPKAIAKPTPEPVVKKKVVAKPKPAAETPPADVASVPPAGGPEQIGGGAGDATGPRSGTGGAGSGGGGGGGGGGTSASPAYGSNPQPPYPMAARRMGIEGTVVLRVVVAPDGTPASVVVLESSGSEILDSSALETVQKRWRFVPARRNGIPVEDSVQVPIRFHQTG